MSVSRSHPYEFKPPYTPSSPQNSTGSLSPGMGLLSSLESNILATTAGIALWVAFKVLQIKLGRSTDPQSSQTEKMQKFQTQIMTAYAWIQLLVQETGKRLQMVNMEPRINIDAAISNFQEWFISLSVTRTHAYIEISRCLGETINYKTVFNTCFAEQDVKRAFALVFKDIQSDYQRSISEGALAIDD